MSYFPFIIAGLIMFFEARAQVECNMKEEQEKALTELAENLKKISHAVNIEKPDGFRNLSPSFCDEFTAQVDQKYRGLASLTYKGYRTYLNDFLEEATKGSEEVKAFKKLMDFFRQGQGLEQMKLNRDAHEIKSNGGKLTPELAGAQRQLEGLLLDRYKILRKNMDASVPGVRPPRLPTTGYSCGPSQGPKDPKKAMNLLITTRTKLTNYLNVCSSTPYDYYPHPKEQRVLSFQLQEGRAMVWFCQQRFQTRRVEGGGNYGPGKESLVESQSECLAFDLLNNRSMLGDQRQGHLAYDDESYMEIKDRRLALRKGPPPMSYPEYLKKNPNLLPENPESFYTKAIPAGCRGWHTFKTSVVNAAKFLREVESISYRRQIEY